MTVLIHLHPSDVKHNMDSEPAVADAVSVRCVNRPLRLPRFSPDYADTSSLKTSPNFSAW